MQIYHQKFKMIFFVSLEGAFKNPGVYGAQQGDTLSQVIKEQADINQTPSHMEEF